MSLGYFRSLTILLVLELAVYETQVNAFTIQRAHPTTPLADLTAAESISLSVRNDLLAKDKDISTTNAFAAKTVPIQTTAKTEEIKKNEIPTTVEPTAYTTSTMPLTTAASISVNATTSKPKIENSTENANVTTTTINNVTSVTNETTTVPVNTTTTITGKPGVTEKIKETTKNNSIDSLGSGEVTNASSITTTHTTQFNDSLATQNSTNTNMTAETTTANNTSLTQDRIGRRTEESNGTSYSPEAVVTSEASIDISSTKDIDGKSQSEPNGETSTTNKVVSSTEATSSSSLSSITETSKSTTTEPQTTINSENEKSSTTDTLKGEYSAVTATPYWKKYTEIDRKRVISTSSEDVVSITSTENDETLVRSATAQGGVTISNPFTISSDIPSLEELKSVLFVQNKTTTEGADKNTPTVVILSTVPVVLEVSTIPTEKPDNNAAVPEETTTAKIDILSSKRAGFLDHSTKTKDVVPPQTIVTEAPYTATTPEMVSIAETTKLTTAKPREVKKNPSMTSQSQLAEDAIKEELMKEEVLSDSAENLKRQGEDRFGNTILQKVDVTTRAQGLDVTFPDESNEDKLSVKPISAEKLRTGLYTVSPNYKPLKKIEVQPPKPFLRDPDDNSWRNESLSSLGIVFKANNSSKPFTEVLKNKTETQWNSLLEKLEKEDNQSELRDRLEKIAEKRKKKKKINKFGETVYADYEETTSAEVSPVKQTTTDMSNDVKYTNPTMTPELKKLTKIFEFEAITPEDIDSTTSKTKKDMDEYDNDDDEPDYTLANIDLKKFLKSGTEGSLVETTVSPITVQTYPERKPTIQYFPPRQKPKKQQKVMMNDYDTDFQRKINEYTFDASTHQTSPFSEPLPTHPPFYFPKIKEVTKRPENRVPQKSRPNPNKNVYLTNNDGFEKGSTAEASQGPDGGYNRASYVIKHLRDFMEEVAKDDEHLVTQAPTQGVTRNYPTTSSKPPNDYYDYEAQFRKDVLDKFVENFNQNSDKYKVDFPILYNTSVVHNMMEEEGRRASSSAFMKRLYADTQAIQNAARFPQRTDTHVNCDRTIELSPAYELHYYVPDEEEKEQIEPKPLTISYRL